MLKVMGFYISWKHVYFDYSYGPSSCKNIVHYKMVKNQDYTDFQSLILFFMAFLVVLFAFNKYFFTRVSVRDVYSCVNK